MRSLSSLLLPAWLLLHLCSCQDPSQLDWLVKVTQAGTPLAQLHKSE